MKLFLDNDTLYMMWLRRIVTAHLEQSWNTDSTEESESADEWYHEQWASLDDVSRHRLSGLSSDLHSLRDQEKVLASVQPMTKSERAKGAEDAFRKHDWDGLLSILRSPPRFESRAMLDYLRGRAWMEMKHPDVALLFFDNATRLEPTNLSYPALALECLKSIPDWDEALIRAEKYRAAGDAPPRLLFRAGDIFHLAALNLKKPVLFERAVEAVDRGLSSLNLGIAQEALESVMAGAFATKSLSLEHLGLHIEALNTLDQALTRLPEHDVLLTERGLLKRQLRIDDADADFESAIRNGTVLVWPYLELARSELGHGNFTRVLELCTSGLARARDDEVAAQLFQLMGIAQFKLNDSLDSVRRAFDASLQLNPFAVESRSNQEKLSSFAGDDRTSVSWEIQSGSSLDAMSEIASRQVSMAA